MASSPEQQRLSPTERANLVAYLDNELPAPEAEAIATKLTHSPTARREAEALQRTWELLEHLSMPRASEALTERTLSGARMIATRGDRLESAFTRAMSRFARNAIWVAASMVAFLLAFAATRWVWPNPTERLARDLSIAEYLDEYRDVGTMDFLEELANSQGFGNDRND